MPVVIGRHRRLLLNNADIVDRFCTPISHDNCCPGAASGSGSGSGTSTTGTPPLCHGFAPPAELHVTLTGMHDFCYTPIPKFLFSDLFDFGGLTATTLQFMNLFGNGSYRMRLSGWGMLNGEPFYDWVLADARPIAQGRRSDYYYPAVSTVNTWPFTEIPGGELASTQTLPNPDAPPWLVSGGVTFPYPCDADIVFVGEGYLFSPRYLQTFPGTYPTTLPTPFEASGLLLKPDIETYWTGNPDPQAGLCEPFPFSVTYTAYKMLTLRGYCTGIGPHGPIIAGTFDFQQQVVRTHSSNNNLRQVFHFAHPFTFFPGDAPAPGPNLPGLPNPPYVFGQNPQVGVYEIDANVPTPLGTWHFLGPPWFDGSPCHYPSASEPGVAWEINAPFGVYTSPLPGGGGISVTA